ncbi:hypothetical protein RXP19_32015, partial [Pseudomonas aeruginosa]|nr:hypothetical protein [Pseudomonas aeruginosa]MEB5161937.1 hypothetical protein [Pseudomonas aeruginosa]MEB5173799.1 hypothetical protein [Pseudomonas aeruginosa]
LRVCLRLPAYSASAKVICFMEKLGWRDRRISPDSGSLFQTFLSNSFCLLYENPRSTKPNSMAHAFARTLRFFNNELAQYQMEGDTPDFLKQRLAISHYVSHVLMQSEQYFFQPKPPKSLQSEETS